MNKFTEENIAKLDERLDRMLAGSPPEKITSGRKLVAAQAEKINAVLKRGWPIEEVLDALDKAGFHMTERTLRTYLQRGAKKEKQGFDPSGWLDYPDGYQPKERRAPSRAGRAAR